MAVDTTLYVHATTLDILDTLCAVTGLKRNRVIGMLFARTMADRNKRAKIGSAIRYQARDLKERWHTVHVRFSEDEADYFKDLRNFLKLSDSLILALAAHEYMEEIVRKARAGEKIDNYPFSNYVLVREEADGLIFWTICWGYPPNPEKHFRPSP